MELWEILVPTKRRSDGKPYRTRYHRVWDAKVRQISGGLTIMPPVHGEWIAKNSALFKERMIPVRIACTREHMDAIAQMTMEYYDQLAIAYYRVSDMFIILERSN